MRFPFVFTLAAFLLGLARAGSATSKHRSPAAPADPQTVVRGVARPIVIVAPTGSTPAEGAANAQSVGKTSASGGSPGAAAAQPTLPAVSVPSSVPATAPSAAPQAPPTPRLIGPPPPLSLSAAQVVVPLGEVREVTLTGALQPPQITAEPDGIVAVTVEAGEAPGLWRLTLRGQATGAAALRVSVEDRVQTLAARVMQYAGQLGAVSIEVTGQPAPVDFVLRAARAAAEGAVQREAGAAVAIGNPAKPPPELPAGQAATVTFPVTISGPNLLAVKGAATVTVRNRDLEPRDVGVLLYSNAPERVTAPGDLFAAELSPDRPARLLYHHQNVSSQPLRLRLELINPTDQPGDVQVIEGLAGPTWDAVEAGHDAAARYLRGALQDLGTIARVPAHSEQAIVLQRLPPGATVSGLFGLRSLSAGLFVRVAAEAASDPPLPLRPAEKPARLSDQVYLSPSRPLKARYVVGKSWTFLNLGSDPLVAHGAHEKLYGNYGVTYEWTLELSNPTDQPQTVALKLSPDAGAARGVFVIDGTLIEAPAVGPPVEADLATFPLQPGERRTVRVQTLPVSGSSYPARLVLRPADPLRAAQAVTGR